MDAVGYRRKCDAYKVFEKNIWRAQVLVDMFAVARNAGRPSEDERALLQGAVVFAVGALDNFIHELILELVPAFGGDGASMREPLRAIAKEDPGIALRVALARDSVQASEEFRAALDNWLDSKSFHGVQAVMTGLSYCGLRLDESAIDKSWRARLEHFTEMRHGVVHRGKQPSLKAADAQECVSLVVELGELINGTGVMLYRS